MALTPILFQKHELLETAHYLDLLNRSIYFPNHVSDYLTVQARISDKHTNNSDLSTCCQSYQIANLSKHFLVQASYNFDG